jgi:hypothetical protein
MTKAKRDYRAEYARRIAKAMAKGLSRSQARGHARAAETASRGPPRPIEDDRLQIAFRVLRQAKSLAVAAKAVKVSPERLRKQAIERGLIEKEGRQWQTRANLPRRVRVFSKGKSLEITVANVSDSSLAMTYMSAVRRFRDTNDLSLLTPFTGQSIRDIAGNEHLFETNPNVLYRLSAGSEHSFEQIYRIVI